MSDQTHEEHDHDLFDDAFHAHKEAAHHFELAAKHHLLAAEAEEKDDAAAATHNAYIAFGHATQGKLFAEEAACAALLSDEDEEGHEDHKH